MILKLITEQLAKKLSKENDLMGYKIINPQNFNQMYNLLQTNNIKEIHIIDSTKTKKANSGTILSVKDHINRTGSNILIGKQKFLGIDFIDMKNIYSYNKESVITNCSGKILNKNHEYPSHYICHIATLAHAININKIHGFLYNTI